MAVAVTYTLQPSGDTTVWGLHVKAYDPNIPLIIDRVVRYPGLIGGSDTDVDPGLVTDRSGAVHVTTSPTPQRSPHP